MYTRSWLAVMVGFTVMPVVQAQSDIPSRVSDAAYYMVKAGPGKPAFIDEYLSSSLIRGSDWDAISPIAAAETVGLSIRNCRNCLNVQVASNGMPRHRLEPAPIAGVDQRTESQSANAGGDSVAVLDIGLMVVFTFCLLAYPLILKQRALQRASVVASQH